jgi:ABC-type nitrate/sulfonate/bicarbonate transport system ATPase subunit/ABC-type nitrate/sulfonate/bicarbonate transport system permease component
LLLLVWHLAASQLPSIIVPSIVSTVRAFGALVVEPDTWRSLSQSLASFACGIVLAAVLGAGVGLATGLSRRAHGFFAPVLGLLNSVPFVAWMGLAMIWFGLGMGPTVFLVIVTTAPILTAALARSLADRDPRYDELADAFGLSPGARLRHITLPPILGTAHASLLAMAGLGWKITVMGELLTASRGLGEILVEAKAHVQTDRVIAVTALLVLVWAVVEGGLRALARPRRATAACEAHADVSDEYWVRTSTGARTSAEEAVRDRALLRCDEVALGYGTVIVDGVSFEVHPGRVLAILGPSGAGKSSLLRVLGGLHDPMSGTVERRDDVRSSIVFQDDRLLPWRTLEQNVSILSGVGHGDVRTHLERLGLLHAATQLPSALSGGMRRRAAFARGCLRDADLLLLDEPFTGLDPLRRAALIDDLESMRRIRHQAIVFVTHHVDDAVLLADEAVVLGGTAPARIIARVDLSALGRGRDAGDPSLSAPRAQLLSALLGEPSTTHAHAPVTNRGTT